MDARVAWLPNPELNAEGATKPFHTFLLKIASRCNLDCSYCYIYTSPDDSWKQRPRLMSLETVQQIANRIDEHVGTHKLQSVSVVFHGGEPLLAGASLLDEYATILSDNVAAEINFAVQTNATLLTPEILDVFAKHKVKIGISLDGAKSINDQNRLYHNGASSFEDVLNAVLLIRSRPDWQSSFGGFLSVINVNNSPKEVYDFFVSIGASSIDLLLPDCHYENPPYRPSDDLRSEAYGKWLACFYDIWIKGVSDMEIRYLEEIIALCIGEHSTLEAIGAPSVDIIVIETDGAIEPVDTLKMIGRSATDIGLNVFTSSFDNALQHPAIFSRMLGSDVLCHTCQECDDLAYCGGGYVPHRYSSNNGFLNPSVYCNDIRFLVRHIQNSLRSSLA